MKTLPLHRTGAAVAGLALASMLIIAFWTIAGAGPVHADHGLPHGTILARGAFADVTDVKIKSTLGGTKRVMHVSDASDVIVQNVTIAPGAQTGWHSHPGPAVAVIATGTLTLYQGDDPSCAGEAFAAGQVFVDPGQGNVHNARNEGAEPVSVYVTYFDVPAGAGPAIPHANPGYCDGF